MLIVTWVYNSLEIINIMKNLAEHIVNGSLEDEHLDLFTEAHDTNFSIYKVHAVLVNNVAFNKTGILNQIRAIPNVTVVTTIQSITSKNLVSVTEKTFLSIKFLIEHNPLQDEMDQIEQEAATIDGVRDFYFERDTLKKIG